MVSAQFEGVLTKQSSDMTAEILEHDVMRGLQLLWVGWDGFKIVAGAATSLCQTPSRKLCRVTVAFGKHTRLWDKFIPMLEQYAKDEDCDALRVEGRRGWKRVLKGFEEPWIVLEKDLN